MYESCYNHSRKRAGGDNKRRTGQNLTGNARSDTTSAERNRESKKRDNKLRAGHNIWTEIISSRPDITYGQG